MAEKAILYDESKCTACRGCQTACKQWNGLPGTTTTNWGSYENPADLSVDTWLKIKFKEVYRVGSNVAWLFTRRSCMHCTDAACVNVCPTGALYHHEMGFVAYDKNRCSGCGYCLEACPFDVPRSSGSKLTGWGKMDKCTFCQDRVSNGLEPACVKSCPPGALKFGDRGELLIEAEKRVDALKAMRNPLDLSGSLFPRANLYGATELNGLHVIYVLTDSVERHGLPDNPQVSGTVTAWQDILQPVGYAAAGAVAVGLGVNYLVTRARMIREKEGK